MTGGLVRVPDDELIARFITFKRYLRADGTVKPEAFMPPPDLQCSVTRHDSIVESVIWDRGHDVAGVLQSKQPERTIALLGRADVGAGAVRRAHSGLDVVEHPLPTNPEHAHVVGWPQKEAQKDIAFKIAEAAKFVATPSDRESPLASETPASLEAIKTTPDQESPKKRGWIAGAQEFDLAGSSLTQELPNPAEP